MLKIKTKLKQSDIHGIGLFADETILKDQLTWELDGLDQLFSVKHPYEWFDKYSYKTKEGRYVLCADDARFINHSDTPNLVSINNQDFAVREILENEELTIDYSTFDASGVNFEVNSNYDLTLFDLERSDEKI